MCYNAALNLKVFIINSFVLRLINISAYFSGRENRDTSYIFVRVLHISFYEFLIFANRLLLTGREESRSITNRNVFI